MTYVQPVGAKNMTLSDKDARQRSHMGLCLQKMSRIGDYRNKKSQWAEGGSYPTKEHHLPQVNLPVERDL